MSLELVVVVVRVADGEIALVKPGDEFVVVVIGEQIGVCGQRGLETAANTAPYSR